MEPAIDFLSHCLKEITIVNLGYANYISRRVANEGWCISHIVDAKSLEVISTQRVSQPTFAW